MRDVFISYSHQDAAFAQELARRLEADGISVWIDYKDTTWGKPFPLSIEEGLDSTRFIICLMSPSWITSAWSSIERYSAMVEDPNGFIGKLLPILLSPDTQIPRFMKPLVYLDCTAPGALDREYARIRDHIVNSRMGEVRPPAAAPRLLDAGGSFLAPLSYIFVVGHPGAGKSTFARMLVSYGERHGIAVDKRSDYLFLQALFRLDMARGDTSRFEPDARSEFKVKDLMVYDEALKLVHEEIVRAQTPPRSLHVIEFARPHYDSSFLYYTMRALVNSAIVHIKAPLEVCEARNELRRLNLERRLAGVAEPGDAFDFEPDTHYVPPTVYERYRRESGEWSDQALALALMPARAYVPIDNPQEGLPAYRERCEKAIEGSLRPLIDHPEKLADFYHRRIAALESFVSRPGTP